MNKNYFAILGVEWNASDDDIKKAYKKLALQFHPDKNNSMSASDHFKEIVGAYLVLRDKDKREMLAKYFKAKSESVDNLFDWSVGDELEIYRTQFSFTFYDHRKVNDTAKGTQATVAEMFLKPNIWNNGKQRQSSKSTWTSNN